MSAGTVARRHPLRARPRSARRAWRALCLGLALVSGPAAAQTGSGGIGHWPPSRSVEIISAEFNSPTARYAHGVLGDAVEWSGLSLRAAGQDGEVWDVRTVLPEDHVFEDLQPRLVDLDLDGRSDAVMVVETDMGLGAALALYGAEGKIAETPHIGTRNRWLAPVGAADLDGDGHVEIAYIDRPHLAKTLRIWRFKEGELAEVASKPGLTNHRIGEDFITSGIRDCGQGSELITVSGDWRRIAVSRLQDGQIISRDAGPFRQGTALRDVLACR
ncbi:FG-GAP repeat domain-containing protein [Leisingera sp. ANG-Vp]|uniref:FG-GAP repeat domain-containing protein n=1 Tax=Leisingera sp. ANG-Vp TaxID=1577896 RepID=UPI00057ECC66|nr:VCBS repeat-containing protein [Leisingera sp. ANG-Vp]KIC19806.1 integrin [Leisingera sp. ANG-Vp]